VLALDAARGLVLAILGGLVSLLSLRNAVLTTRTRLEVDDLGLRGRLHNQQFNIPWSDVHALRLVADIFDSSKPSLVKGFTRKPSRP